MQLNILTAPSLACGWIAVRVLQSCGVRSGRDALCGSTGRGSLFRSGNPAGQQTEVPCSFSLLYESARLHAYIPSLPMQYPFCAANVLRCVLVAQVFVWSSAVLWGQADALHAADRQELLRRVHNLERHMRENKLRFTFTDALGRAQTDANDQATSHAMACFIYAA